MMPPPALIQRSDGFGANRLASCSRTVFVADFLAPLSRADHMLHHIAAIIHFAQDSIGMMTLISAHDRSAPFVRGTLQTVIRQDVSMAVRSQTCDHDATLDTAPRRGHTPHKP